jgi:hypothetical protein
MPRYDFICPRCDNTIELNIIPNQLGFDYHCSRCSTLMNRVWNSPPSIRMPKDVVGDYVRKTGIPPLSNNPTIQHEGMFK